MAMKQWIRNNLVLLSGIVLPVLLVVAFLILQGAPRLLTDSPRYDFLVAAHTYEARHARDLQVSFEVRDERLLGRVAPLSDGNAVVPLQPTSLFRYRADEHAFSEITWELPADLEGLAAARTFEIPQLAGVRLDKSGRSPDGFLFEFAGYRGRGGLLGEMFGMGRYDSWHVLSRDGAEFELPNPGGRRDNYAQEVQFLGWVIDESAGP